MKASAVLSGTLSLLVAAARASAFTPPQVFRNTNLVRVVSAEKNYVKETVNVVVENIDKEDHDDYYLPFTPDQASRLGAIEVRDRKDADAASFAVDAVEYDPAAALHYYRVRLPAPLKPGAQQTLGITYFLLRAYRPLPPTINQDEAQYLSLALSAYAPSAYATAKQKTELKLPSSNAPDYTRLPGSGDVAEFPAKQGSKLTYGPFSEQAAGALAPVAVRFEFNKPVLHVSALERDVEVSHWGGNVAFEERYALHHRGANLTTLFSRVKWAQQQYYSPNTHALRELRFPLRAGSADAYYTDVIGNVSTSRFRSSKRDALLEARPRYPVFGGWKYPFTIGWNADAGHFLRRAASGSFVLNVPFLEGPKQPEGVEYGKVQLRVILPEGAENVKYHTNLPASAITDVQVQRHKTFLDTIGRTVLVIKASNLVDALRDCELVVSYDYPLTASLRKPLVVFGSVMAAFVGAWALGTVDMKFSSGKQ